MSNRPLPAISQQDRTIVQQGGQSIVDWALGTGLAAGHSNHGLDFILHNTQNWITPVNLSGISGALLISFVAVENTGVASQNYGYQITIDSEQFVNRQNINIDPGDEHILVGAGLVTRSTDSFALRGIEADYLVFENSLQISAFLSTATNMRLALTWKYMQT